MIRVHSHQLQIHQALNLNHWEIGNWDLGSKKNQRSIYEGLLLDLFKISLKIGQTHIKIRETHVKLG